MHDERHWPYIKIFSVKSEESVSVKISPSVFANPVTNDVHTR